MTHLVDAILEFDIDAAIREAKRAYAERPEEDRDRHRAAVDRARFDAARFLLERGDAEDRRLAARFIFGMTRSAA